jgi:hypothetical protein
MQIIFLLPGETAGEPLPAAFPGSPHIQIEPADAGGRHVRHLEPGVRNRPAQLQVCRIRNEAHAQPGRMSAETPDRRRHFAFRFSGKSVIRRIGIGPALAFDVEELHVIPKDALVVLFGFRRIDQRLRAGLCEAGNGQ